MSANLAGWLQPGGTCKRIRPANLGIIGNGHHIKMERDCEPSPWDQSFERVFDKADSSFSELIRWLDGLERKPVGDVTNLTQRFFAQSR